MDNPFQGTNNTNSNDSKFEINIRERYRWSIISVMIKGMSQSLDRIVELVHRYLADPQASWCVATYGAIAEFHIKDIKNMKSTFSETGGNVITDWGSMSINLTKSVRIIPYETLARRKKFWLHGINFCLPKSEAQMASRSVLTELGEDKEPLKSSNSSNYLFDLGLDIKHIDACIRTADEELLKTLRKNIGKSLFDATNTSFFAIKEASPERVFKSKLGKIEVRQTIGSTSRNIPTPPGPHTHVLPKLLKHKRTHANNIFIPPECSPSLGLFPPNPILNEEGGPKPFDTEYFNQFQEILNLYGNEKILEAKSNTKKAVLSGKYPPSARNLDRKIRAAKRISLRQLLWTNGESKALSKWRSEFENTKDDLDNGDFDIH